MSATSSQAGPRGVPFSFFVSLLREISHHRPRKAGVRRDKSSAYPALTVLRNWIDRLRSQFAPLAEGTTAIVFRLLFPEEDARRKYDMQETRLASALADCLGVSADALRKWGSDDSSGCLGEEVLNVLNKSSSVRGLHAVDYISPLSIAEVDALLDELASHSGFSDRSVREKHPHTTRRRRAPIIRALFRSLLPLDAAFLAQIILKDLRPLLYPLTETHYTAALKSFNSSAVTQLSKEDAMKAWDPSWKMLDVYCVRSRLDDASNAFDSGITGTVMPLIGTPVEIPKSEKGRSCLHALQILRQSKELWAETKYDGERTQIHVEILTTGSRITIFSKSKRDSTLDRHGIHCTIRAALGLPEDSSNGHSEGRVTSNIILDAEMVAWHAGKIDEFWRIHGLVEHTAVGVRKHLHDAVPIENYSQTSLMTDVSDDRHLGLVFFDILLLNSTSLLSESYSSRRATLESVIKPIPGRAILADRQPIALNLTPNDRNPSLHRVFAQCLARPEEGLVLKAGESGYNDRRFPWVKLKRDYIPGYGDCVDLVVLGALWDKSRGRELRVAPSAYTTFYIGGLHNAEELARDPSARPHFHIYFTASYGLSRDALEEVNFLVKSSDTVSYDSRDRPSDFPFTYSLLPGLVPPTAILREPLLAELYGAGFTKSPGSRHYELRFPRITKIFRTKERSWRDGVTLQDLHKVARDCVGRERTNKDVDDWSNILWGKPVSPGITGAKRKRVADEWEEKLIAADRQRERKRGWTAFDSRLLRSRARVRTESPVRPRPLPFGSRTNLVGSLSSPLAGTFPANPQPSSSFPRPPSSPLAGSTRTSKSQPSSLFPRPAVVPYSSPFAAQPATYGRPTTMPIDLSKPSPFSSPLAPRPKETGQPPATPIDSVTDVLSKSLVFVAAQDPVSRRRWKQMIPPERMVHSLESLFAGCGWDAEQTQPPSPQVQQGVIVFDAVEEQAHVSEAVHARKALYTERSERKAILLLHRKHGGESGLAFH